MCSPWSYSITSPVVWAQPYRKHNADITTQESGNRFHISDLFCHYCSGTWAEKHLICFRTQLLGKLVKTKETTWKQIQDMLTRRIFSFCSVVRFKPLQQLSLILSLKVSAYIPADHKCHTAADEVSYRSIRSADVSDVRSVQRHHRLNIKNLHSFISAGGFYLLLLLTESHQLH